MISDLSSTTLLAVFVIALAAGGLICGAYMLVAVWRDDPIFARPTHPDDSWYPFSIKVDVGSDDWFPFPARPLPAPPRRPFDHDRDRWEW